LSAAEARELGFKIQIWPILSLTENFAATRRAMKELKETGFHTQPAGGSGKLREIWYLWLG
jgi:2-methylisocitrate lyase-like PEP mutase family enzyme